MATERRKIRLSEIAGEVGDYVDEVPALDPTGDDSPQIVERSPSGAFYIVDGFHRTAGQVRWCRENGVDPAGCSVVVVICDDPALVRDAAEPGPRQDAAIAAIYAAAGLGG
jgi:hypothetical protein